MYETSNVGKYQPVVIGIDHGFSLIKTYHHIMSNGVAKTSGRPPVLENSLYYDGNYYVIGGSRMTVNEDKTENDNYFILTLAAIAKELKTRGIEKFAKVVLGVGVPFKRFGEEQAYLVDYLTRSGLIVFGFERQDFTIVIQKVICYPQCFAAIADRISNMEGRYVVADIGSWTKDIVCIDNKRINVEQSVTISHSIITLFQGMNSAIYAKTGKRIPEDILQDFILGKEVILPFDVKEIIERQLMGFAHKTEGQLNEYGFDIDYSNIIYVGGGATIMRRFAPDRANVSYLEDVRLNARGYELLAKSQLNRS